MMLFLAFTIVIRVLPNYGRRESTTIKQVFVYLSEQLCCSSIPTMLYLMPGVQMLVLLAKKVSVVMNGHKDKSDPPSMFPNLSVLVFETTA